MISSFIETALAIYADEDREFSPEFRNLCAIRYKRICSIEHLLPAGARLLLRAIDFVENRGQAFFYYSKITKAGFDRAENTLGLVVSGRFGLANIRYSLANENGIELSNFVGETVHLNDIGITENGDKFYQSFLFIGRGVLEFAFIDMSFEWLQGEFMNEWNISNIGA